MSDAITPENKQFTRIFAILIAEEVNTSVMNVTVVSNKIMPLSVISSVSSTPYIW